MKNNNEESENFTNNLNKKQTKVFDDVAKNYDQTLEIGKQIGKESFDKINEVASNGANYIKSKPYWKSIKNSSLKIKEKSLDSSTVIKKKSPKFYKKISNDFFNFFEKFVGRIKIGTQYGLENLEILERLAKLKELGILTDEEFLKQKKKILDRTWANLSKNITITILALVVSILVGIVIVSNYSWFTQEWSIGLAITIGGIVGIGLVIYIKNIRK